MKVQAELVGTLENTEKHMLCVKYGERGQRMLMGMENSAATLPNSKLMLPLLSKVFKTTNSYVVFQQNPQGLSAWVLPAAGLCALFFYLYPNNDAHYISTVSKKITFIFIFSSILAIPQFSRTLYVDCSDEEWKKKSYCFFYLLEV